MYNLLDGREASKTRKELLKKLIEPKEHKPSLVVITVGDDEASKVYVRGKEKDCAEVGIDFKRFAFDETVTTNTLCEVINGLNRDDDVDGVIVQLPIPNHLDKGKILKSIAPEKDVDCFSPMNTAKLMEGDKTGFPPCTPTAVVEILKHYNVPLKGAKVVVLGRSMVVGKPVSMLLLGENATVTICHSKTQDLQKVCADADVLVAGVGRARMVTADYVKEGAVVIDVGINAKPEGGGICGDVDTDDVVGKASMVTPVPAGVGSVTTSILAKHVIKACKQQNNK